jgi:hypothetical protein
MKRIVQILVAVIVFLSAGIVSAANWQWVSSDDYYTIFFDKESIRYELEYDARQRKFIPNPSIIIFWKLTAYTEPGANEYVKMSGDIRYADLYYSYVLEKISLTDETLTHYFMYYYDYNNKLIVNAVLDDQQHPYKKVPNSRGEKIFNAVRDYARTHHDDLIRNTYRN